MRGWRITDNDTKTATDEGSLILPRTPAFAAVPRGTVILVIATENESNAANFPRDDLDVSDGRMILYVGNGTLDTTHRSGLWPGPFERQPGAARAWPDGLVCRRRGD